MLIDLSYFRGELNIVTNQDAQEERLNWFIEKYEPEFLRKLLGYERFAAFMNGLIANPIDSEWVDLLSGAEYLDSYGLVRKWNGLVEDSTMSLKLNLVNSIPVIVGRGNANDPVSGTSTTTIPANLVGKAFVFSQSLFGELVVGVDYTITENTITLLGGHIFSKDDKYFFRPTSSGFKSQPGLVKKSMIANYVYYWYMRDLTTQTSAVGEVATKTANSGRTDASQKMVRAWNELVSKVWEYRQYAGETMGAGWVLNGSTYRGWYQRVDEFSPINVFGI